MGLPIREGIVRLREHGFIPFLHGSLNQLGVWKPIWNTVTSRYPFGTNIFEREWDVLVVLDACRVDSLRSVSDSITWLDNVTEMRSVGSMSAEWVLQTFSADYREEIADTALITENIWTHRILHERVHEHSNQEPLKFHHGAPDWRPVSSDAFAHYEMISADSDSNQYEPLHPDDTTAPHVVTDRAIAIGRQEDYDRLIVHYMLPHLNFIADAVEWVDDNTSYAALMTGPNPIRELTDEEKHYPRDSINDGSDSAAPFRRRYRQNIRLALAYTKILFDNIDAEIAVVTSDHGEAFGEHGIWNHPYGYPLSPPRTVPWAMTTATDERTYVPQYDPPEETIREETQMKQLKQLGYV